jgi:hypothetical protein
VGGKAAQPQRKSINQQASASDGSKKTAAAAAAAMALTPLSALAAAAEAAAAGVSLDKGKKIGRRTNWGERLVVKRLTQALGDWEGKKGVYYTPGMTMKAFAAAVRISEKTLGLHIRSEKVTGKSAGRPGHLWEGESKFVVSSVHRRGRGRDGLGPGEISSMVQKLNPGLSAKQATNTASFPVLKTKTCLPSRRRRRRRLRPGSPSKKEKT